MPTEKLEKYPGSAVRRVPALPGAAMVLESIIQLAKPEHIVFSASGIREGYLYEKLPADLREEDGLLSSCMEFSSKGGRSITYAQEMYDWMSPLLGKESEKERRLRMAFCLLADIAQHIHPEYRAMWAFQRLQFSALTSLTHRERIKLALALYHRYQAKIKDEPPALSLLKNDDKSWARLVGAAANLAYHLSGSIEGNLPKTAFIIKGGNVSLELSGAMQDVMGDAIAKRLAAVDEAFKEFSS